MRGDFPIFIHRARCREPALDRYLLVDFGDDPGVLHEVNRRRGRGVRVTIGAPIPFSSFAPLRDRDALLRRLRATLSGGAAAPAGATRRARVRARAAGHLRAPAQRRAPPRVSAADRGLSHLYFKTCL